MDLEDRNEKILKGVFFVLVLIFLVEIGYFIYLNFKKSKEETFINTVEQQEISSPTPTSIQRNGVQAVNNNTLENLKNLNQGIVKSLISQGIYEGEIIELVPLTSDGKIKIRIQGENNETNSFYFYQEEKPKIIITKIIIKKNGQVASFDDLKIGDKIKIKEELDLLQNTENNLIKFEIEVL